MGVDWGALGDLWGLIGVLRRPDGGRLGCSGGPMGVDRGALGRFGHTLDPPGPSFRSTGVGFSRFWPTRVVISLDRGWF